MGIDTCVRTPVGQEPTFSHFGQHTMATDRKNIAIALLHARAGDDPTPRPTDWGSLTIRPNDNTTYVFPCYPKSVVIDLTNDDSPVRKAARSRDSKVSEELLAGQTGETDESALVAGNLARDNEVAFLNGGIQPKEPRQQVSDEQPDAPSTGHITRMDGVLEGRENDSEAGNKPLARSSAVTEEPPALLHG